MSIFLWAVGMDGLDIEGLERTGELGQLTLVVGMIDAEDTVLIGIQSHGTAVLMEITVEGFHVGLGCLCGRETQRQQFTGGIIDEDDQRTARAPILEPVMG